MPVDRSRVINKGAIGAWTEENRKIRCKKVGIDVSQILQAVGPKVALRPDLHPKAQDLLAPSPPPLLFPSRGTGRGMWLPLQKDLLIEWLNETMSSWFFFWSSAACLNGVFLTLLGISATQHQWAACCYTSTEHLLSSLPPPRWFLVSKIKEK